MTIGEVAARTGLSHSALRFYERQGLVAAGRTDGNQRHYPRSVLRRLAFIQAGVAAGIPLAQIRAALDTLPAGRSATRHDWERLSSAWRDDLDRRIDLLTGLRDRLTTCIGCGCLSLETCSLLNPDDEAASLGTGPRYLVAARDR